MWKSCHLLYSPFSPNSEFNFRQRSLLVQFLLSSMDRGHAKELAEHVSLLPFAFPGLCSEDLRKMAMKLPQEKKIPPLAQKKLSFLLTPFLHACCEEESLILFLLRHRKTFEKQLKIGELLRSWYPHGLDEFFCKIQEKWQRRGHPLLSQEIAELAKNL